MQFVPGLLPYTMRYTNRPTGIQQVITFTGHRPVATSPGSRRTTASRRPRRRSRRDLRADEPERALPGPAVGRVERDVQERHLLERAGHPQAAGVDRPEAERPRQPAAADIERAGEAADALGDRSLKLVYWRPSAGHYVTFDGRPVALRQYHPAAGRIEPLTREVATSERPPAAGYLDQA